LKECNLCPRNCMVNRTSGQEGICHTTTKAIVSSYGPHFGEEAPLVGRDASGTIFFTFCNLNCIFCQNYTISQSGEGKPVDSSTLADIMLKLQNKGCHNINLVSPTHVVPYILDALLLATDEGLSLPLVYNSGGYDSVHTLALLDGVIDIYMPDMKYSDDAAGKKYSGVDNYWSVNKVALKEMHRQVGDLRLGGEKVATGGLLIRHLVLPNRLAGTEGVVRFLAEEISKDTYLNVMSQYHPCHKAYEKQELARSITTDEFDEAVNIALQYGLRRLDERVPQNILRRIFG
jgi:putative pyruvate formate lyase activating enzyme